MALAAVVAGGHAAAECKLGRLVELPVTMVDMKPMVTAKINGVDAQFVADSGAFYSIINAASAAELKLKTTMGPMGLRVSGIGGDAGISLTTVKVFTLAGISIPNVEFMVGGGDTGGGGVGLLGQNVFRIGDVEYDLAHGAIRLIREQGCGKENLAYWAAATPEAVSAMDIEYTTPLSPHTKGTAMLNGVKIRVMFDTGDDISFVSLRAAQRAGISIDAPGVKYAGMSRGIGRETVRTWIVPVANFALGGEEIRNTHLRVAESVINDADMLIGADFFLSHRVYVASKHARLYFTYNGGPVFNLALLPSAAAAPAAPAGTTPPAGTAPTSPTAPPAQAASAASTAQSAAPTTDPAAPTAPGQDAPPVGKDEPKDAAGFSRRGSALAARRDFAAALADLSRACEMAPQEPDYFYERGITHAEAGQLEAALADLDQAIVLKPDDVPALVARAHLRFTKKDVAQAADDLETADRFASKEADVRLTMAYGYVSLERLPQAVAQLDLWIAAHKVDARLGQALNERCWIRTLTDQELPKALDDCNAALKLVDKKAVESASVFDSRGLVRLRLGDYRRSIADYDEALKLRPKDAWSLYGKGVDEVRLGNQSQGQADMAAASAIWPAIVAAFEKRGIQP